ncbi:MAG: O-antigen ligase family protein [Actinomycetota bacterium]
MPVSEALAPTASHRRPERTTSSASGRDRIAVVFVCIAIAGMPFLVPSGPGNTAPIDFLIGAAVVAVAVWLSASGERAHAPFAVPVIVLALAGIIAAVLGPSPLRGSLAVIQDVFLLVWAAAVANVSRTPAALSAILATWSWSAIIWAGALILSGVVGSEATRGALTFGNPNLAASYLVVSWMILIASGHPRRRGLRLAACTVVLIAILVTGSLAGLVGVVVAALSLLVLTVARRAGLVPAFGLLMGLLFIVGLTASWIATSNVFENAASSSNIVIRHSIGRAQESSSHRTSLYGEELGLFWTGSVWGVGPGATEKLLGEGQSTQTKEAHNDYLAVLVERGVLGVIGLMLLVAAAFIRAKAISVGDLEPSYAAVVPVPAAIAAALIAVAATAMFHEVLHFRHLWALLGVVGALYLFGRAEKTPRLSAR